MSPACATCASTYHNPSAPLSEKPLLPGRTLDCCQRTICARCLNQNKRYETYCPYCQISSVPSLLPPGLRDPPAYSSLDGRIQHAPLERWRRRDDADAEEEELPAYAARGDASMTTEKEGGHYKEEDDAPDVLHFLLPSDTMRSLSLAYGVPINALRKTNNVFADHLLAGRKTVLIPGEYYKGGVSLSPQPIESEEEEIKKTKVRRWMVACKVADYDVALLYLKSSEWDLEMAIDVYRDDETWERDNPQAAKQRVKKGKSVKDVGMRRFVGEATSIR